MSTLFFAHYLGKYQAAITAYNQALSQDRQRGIFPMQRAMTYKNMGYKTRGGR